MITILLAVLTGFVGIFIGCGVAKITERYPKFKRYLIVTAVLLAYVAIINQATN